MQGCAPVMKILILLIVAIGLVVTALLVRSNLIRANRKHDPIEYYRGWGGYWHPIVLENKITEEEADALAAKGTVYLVGYYDADGRLIRVVKFCAARSFSNFSTPIIPTAG
jgi:hypothetical protein